MQYLKVKIITLNKKPLLLFILPLMFFVYFSPYILLASSPEPLQSLGVATSTYQSATEGTFLPYVNALVTILIGIAASLAVIFVTIGGVQYITTDSLTGKESGKETINNALLGLLIALAAWLILFTINPDLVGKTGDSFTIDPAI